MSTARGGEEAVLRTHPNVEEAGKVAVVTAKRAGLREFKLGPTNGRSPSRCSTVFSGNDVESCIPMDSAFTF